MTEPREPAGEIFRADEGDPPRDAEPVTDGPPENDDAAPAGQHGPTADYGDE